MFQKVMQSVLLLMLLGITQTCTAEPKNESLIIVNGTIRVVGSEPLAHVVIRTGTAADKDRDYLITGPLAKELRRDFQGKVVTLEGKACSSSVPRISKCLKPTKITVE